jgi:hypothetical protein
MMKIAVRSKLRKDQARGRLKSSAKHPRLRIRKTSDIFLVLNVSL